MKEFKSFYTKLSEECVTRYKDVSKAILVTGCPGSGKDVVIREIISKTHITELNHQQVYRFLADKDNLSKKSHDMRLEAVRKHNSLIINAPADDIDKILYIKEELEEMNYEVMMLYVHTSDNISKERNERLSRSLEESVRHDKWLKAESNKEVFQGMFENFIQFNNIHTLNESVNESRDIYKKINSFLLEKVKLKYNADGPDDITPDNRPGPSSSLGDSIKGDTGPRKSPVKKSYIFRTYSESAPTLKVSPEPKESNFSMDNDKKKVKKRGDTSLKKQNMVRPSGIGREYDTRAGGQGAAAGAGLGNQTYSEDVAGNYDVANFAGMVKGPEPNPLSNQYDQKKPFKKLRKSLKEFNGFQNDDEGMGVGGTLGGATNKEPMQSYKDSNRNIGIQITKKKKGKKDV
jgi:broad-specificity NMP kinase